MVGGSMQPLQEMTAMIRTPSSVASGATALLAAAAVAGYASSSSAATTTRQTPANPAGTSVSSTAASSARASASTVVIGSFKTPQDGTLITGVAHRSLYILTADEKSTSSHDKLSTCYNACTSVWPPVLASKLPAVTGLARRSLVGLTTRKGGSKQVTYNGLPLYYYVADAKAGESVGNHLKDGFGLWIGMLPNGKLAPDGAN
jgi:predicted lipoprotein with Yx(FWY)xxD motif